METQKRKIARFNLGKTAQLAQVKWLGTFSNNGLFTNLGID
jgi:hypothetical protein